MHVYDMKFSNPSIFTFTESEVIAFRVLQMIFIHAPSFEVYFLRNLMTKLFSLMYLLLRGHRVY